MHSVETAPRPFANSEAQSAAAAETSLGAQMPAAEHAGAAVLDGAAPGLRDEMHAHVSAEDLAAMNAIANGVDVHAGEEGRVLDVEAAREQAERENEMFNLHTAALEEDAQRAQAKLDEQAQAAAEAQKEEPQAATAKEEPAAAKAKSEQPAAEIQQAAGGNASLAKEAEAALKEAGVTAHITEQTKIIKEPLGNKLLVVNGDHIQVLTPDATGGHSVTDYRYDRSSQTLSIGESSFMPADKYQPEGQNASQVEQTGVVTLPPSVANIVGFERVVPAAAAHPAEAPAAPQQAA